MVKRPKKFVIVDDSSPAVAQAKSREQRVPTSFRVKMRILNGVPEDKLVKVWIFRYERGRQHVFWPLSGLWLPKQLTEKLSWTIMRVVKREKLSSTIMKNLNKFKRNDSWFFNTIHCFSIDRFPVTSTLSKIQNSKEPPKFLSSWGIRDGIFISVYNFTAP